VPAAAQGVFRNTRPALGPRAVVGRRSQPSADPLCRLDDDQALALARRISATRAG
jgi:hypothetical protein